MSKIIAAIGLLLISYTADAAEQDISGTYRLVSMVRVIVDTGQVVDTFGEHPQGYIIYQRDGHFLAVITYNGILASVARRPKPELFAQMTDQQSADLLRTDDPPMAALTPSMARRSSITSSSHGTSFGRHSQSSGMSRAKGTN